MQYQERPLIDSDSKLIKFIDADSEGEGAYDTVTYVKFKYDLSHDQIDSIKQEADKIDYYDFDTFDDWVEVVVKKAMKHKCWKNDKGNDGEFWEPYPCLEIEV